MFVYLFISANGDSSEKGSLMQDNNSSSAFDVNEDSNLTGISINDDIETNHNEHDVDDSYVSNEDEDESNANEDDDNEEDNEDENEDENDVDNEEVNSVEQDLSNVYEGEESNMAPSLVR